MYFNPSHDIGRPGPPGYIPLLDFASWPQSVFIAFVPIMKGHRMRDDGGFWNLKLSELPFGPNFVRSTARAPGGALGVHTLARRLRRLLVFGRRRC